MGRQAAFQKTFNDKRNLNFLKIKSEILGGNMKKRKRVGFITFGIAIVSICSIISIALIKNYTLAPEEETKQDVKTNFIASLPQQMKEVSSEAFVSPREDDYLIFYYSNDCIISENLVPSIEEYSSKSNALPIYAINVMDEENEKLVEQEHIIGTPTVIHMRNGEEVWRTIGKLDLNQLPTIL